MVRLFRRAARLLMAGAIGASLAGPLAAQDSSRHTSSVQVTTSQMRLEAMKAEMALLADYATFQLPLQVRVGEDCLELHGQIGDDDTRQTALRIARQACYLPVRDCTRVASRRRAGRDYDTGGGDLRRSAEDMIRRALDGHVKNLHVEASVDGQVTLTGQVESVEDKVAASRALRELSGCQSVVNGLTVRTVRESGHTLTLVTRDGQHAVHGALPHEESEAPPAPHRTAHDADEYAPPLRRPHYQDVDYAPPSRRPYYQDEEPPPSRPQPPTNSRPGQAAANNGPGPTRDVYVRLRTANNQPLANNAPAAYTPANNQAPQQPLVIAVPYPAQAPAANTQAAPTLKPRTTTMLNRMRSALGISNDPPPPAPAVAAPTPLPLLIAAPANQPAQAFAVGPTPVAPTAHLQVPQPTATASAGAWPPAYNMKNAPPVPVARGAVMSHSPAIRLAARPEDAAKPPMAAPQPQMVAQPVPAMPAVVVATQPAPQPAPPRTEQAFTPPAAVRLAPTPQPVVAQAPPALPLTPAPQPIAQAPPQAPVMSPVVQAPPGATTPGQLAETQPQLEAAPIASLPPAEAPLTQAPPPLKFKLPPLPTTNGKPTAEQPTLPVITPTPGHLEPISTLTLPQVQPTPKQTSAPTPPPALKQTSAAQHSEVPAVSTTATPAAKPVPPAPALSGPMPSLAQAVPAIPAPAKTLPVKEVQKHVAKACGKLATSVKVEAGKDGRPVAHINAVANSENDIIKNLMADPEIAASNIRVQIHVP